jgi:hypothetical protein
MSKVKTPEDTDKSEREVEREHRGINKTTK